MKARVITLLGVVLMLSAVALVWSPFATYLAVDGCLDAGGSFNYTSHDCDFENSHPYAPENNSARLRSAFALALAGVALTIFGRYRRG
jgi:hypothetical protein